MGALDKIIQQDEAKQATETLAALTSNVSAVERHLTTLTGTVAELTQFVQTMDRQQDERLNRIALQLYEQPSMRDGEMTSRLSEIEQTLTSVAESLATVKTVALPNGETINESDFNAYTMMQTMNEHLTTMTTASADLADAVRKKGNVRIDVDALNQHAVKVLDNRLAMCVRAQLADIEAHLVNFEQRVASAGAQSLNSASAETEKVISKANEVIRAVDKAGNRVETLSGRVTWTTLGRMAAALIPLAAVLLVIGGLTMGAAYALGFGPLLDWAWQSFTDADTWWAKALIATATLGGVAAFSSTIWWVARKLRSEYRRW